MRPVVGVLPSTVDFGAERPGAAGDVLESVAGCPMAAPIPWGRR
jgi:hypothetical protein